MKKTLAALLLVAALIPLPAWADLTVSGTLSVSPSVSPVQGSNPVNSSTTGAANTAVSATVTGVAGKQTHIYYVLAVCSAPPAAALALTVTDGGTTVFSTIVGNQGNVQQWPVALTGTVGGTMVVTMGACGAGITGTLNVQADQQ